MRKYGSIFFLGILFFWLNPVIAQSPPAATTDTARPPQTFAMIMGISTYKYIRPLTYADKDAEMFRDYLKSPSGGKVPDANIYCLLNEQAMAANFWVKGMAWLRSKNVRKGDRLFFYLAGHGDAINQDEFFFLTYDCNPAGDKNNYIVTGNVQLYTLKSRIGELSRKGVEVVFIMDACRSNELPGGTEGQQVLNSAISEKRAGEIIMLATGAGQESLEDASIGNGHGLFTYYLVDGLNGMADAKESADYKITLGELQTYVEQNVPSIASERFKRKQEPFFCCNENTEKLIGIVDSAYLASWLKTKQLKGKGPGNSFSPRSRGTIYDPVDTMLIATYNLFNKAIKESRLTGNTSAEYYFELMAKKYPGTSYTIDAQSTLAVEYINFAQSKINLYLECKDAASVQKVRAQLEESEKTDELTTGLDRLDKVARQEFAEVGIMLEKAIRYIAADDPDFARTLQGRMNFFKARGYYGKDRRLMDISQAFQYAHTANASEKNAAYILNTLASLHFDNNRVDSAILYARQAIHVAPQWRYPYVTLAFAFKNLGKVDSALKYYRKAVQVDGGSADAYVDLGHYYYSLSRADSAIANYQRALQMEPSNVYASNNIGWLQYDRKNFDAAISAFRQTISRDPKFIPAYNGLSKAFVAKGLFDSARISFAKAFVSNPDKSGVNVYIGNFFKDLKMYDSASRYFHLAAVADPLYEEAWNNLGIVNLQKKEFDSANYYFRKALAVNPYSAFSYIQIGLVFREMKQADSTYAYFQRAIKMDPSNPAILNNLGVIYRQANIADSAKVYFKRALQVRPDYRPSYNNLMKIFREAGQVDSVSNYLKSLPQFDPNSISNINDLGLLFLEQKRYDSARTYYYRALQLNPFNAQLANNLGMVFREMKQYDSARVYLQRAVRMDPVNVSAITNLSAVFRQLRQYDSAGYYFRKQLAVKQVEEAPADEALAFFFQETKLYDSSIYYFKRVLNRQPERVVALNNVGLGYMNLEQTDSSLAYYQKAFTLSPDNYTTSMNLGLLYHSMRQYDSAIARITHAIKINPSAAKAYFTLGCSYALAGNTARAIDQLRMAYEKGYKNFNALLDDPDLSGLKGNKDYEALLDKYVKGWREK